MGVLNEIGEILDPAVVVLLIGERPGLATAESLSAYMAYRPRFGHDDSRRNVISNIHARGVACDQAARRIARLAEQMIGSGLSGVNVKEQEIAKMISASGLGQSYESYTHYIVREMTADDVAAVAALHVATFNETHTGGRNNGPTYELREQQWRAAFASTDWFAFVVENEHHELIGFAKGTPHDGGVPGFEGELNKIYLLRRYHRHGIGRALLCRVAKRFLSRGVSSMVLFGDAENPSNRFYEAMGAERLYSAAGQFHGGYGWCDLQALVELCGN